LARLHLDCSSGMAGNMLVGLCLDLGVPFQEFEEFIFSLDLDGFKLVHERVEKRGIMSRYFDVELSSDSQKSRFLPEIIEIIGKSPASNEVKNRACNVFQRLAVAEAAVHGVSPDEVHFHEVGAVDAIIDILGSCWCMERLHVRSVTADSLYTGRGWTTCAHGVMPVPAPATAELLLGVPYQQGEVGKELLTPTGAALLAEWVDIWGERPTDFVAGRVGYGAGKWELEAPNVVRGYLGADPSPETEKLWMLETHVDDTNPQFIPELQEKLLEMGALDTWVTPIQMKKGRPGILLSVLAFECFRDQVEMLIFSRIPTLGIRRWAAERTVLARSFSEVEVQGKKIRIKEGAYQGKVMNRMPEWEDCQKAAGELNLAPREVWMLAFRQMDLKS